MAHHIQTPEAMEFRIEPCTVDDGPALAVNNMHAFWENGNWALPWRDRGRDDLTAQSTLRQPFNLLRELDVRRHQKAVDVANGEIVGYCRWVLPSELEGVADVWSEARVPRVSEEHYRELETRHASANWETNPALDSLDDPSAEARKRLTNDKQYLNLQYLAVHPRHQRKGIASKLVASGLAVADRLGLVCFVQAFEAGLNTYYKYGFETIEVAYMDDSAFGGPGKYQHTFMLRQPQPIK